MYEATIVTVLFMMTLVTLASMGVAIVAVKRLVDGKHEK